MKIIPKLFEYVRLAGKASILETKPASKLTNNTNLLFDSDKFVKLKHSETEIAQAYRTYAESPYVNAYLRNNEPMSVDANNIVSCLKQAICGSKPVKGVFVRGLNGTRRKPLNDETISDYIFSNAGFSSAAPVENARYAHTFAGNKGAVVDFHITKPMQAYAPSSYEVVFDTNAFTPEKFGIEKIGERHYKVFQK